MKKKILLVILAIIFIAINPVFAARKGAKTVEQLDEVVLETPEAVSYTHLTLPTKA